VQSESEGYLGILSWIVFGLLAGWVAGALYGRGKPEGCLSNIAVGVFGALLGGAVYTLITGHDFTTSFDLPSLIVAVLGSLLLIFLLNVIGRNRA
jgi:uncharacterized membrane protein YeaQ/YmgE (transglycosylase-associated protein family)